jgi:hypothetical protein
MTRGTSTTGIAVTVLSIAGLLVGLASPVRAQTLPNSIQQPQNPQIRPPVTISPIQPSSAPTSGLPANVLTPATTTQETAGAPGRIPVFSGAGQGLPGMPGGPAINTPLGARDPSAQYMRPPTVGPLLCDPAVDVQC